MDKNAETILRDLYTIDPRFKKHETEITSVISTVLSSKPKVNFDPSFQARLRNQLMNADMSAISSVAARTASKLSPFRYLLVPTEFRSSILVAIIAILIVAPLTYVATEKSMEPVSLKDLTSSLTQKQQITLKPSNAFGPIALVKTASASASTAKVSSTARSSKNVPPVAQQQTLIAPAIATTVAPTSTTSSIEIDVHQTASIGAVDVPQYYYAGKPLSLDKEGAVLKRTTGSDAGAALLSVLKGLHFDLTNLSSFNGLSVQTIKLNENKPYGYSLVVDMANGSIDILKDAAQWDSTPIATTTLTASENIAIASDFLKVHGIDVSNYGKPYVDTSVKTEGQATVMYPLIINKNEVYQEDGTQYGITVIVDNATKKVVEVHNIISQLYDSSNYPFESNPVKLLASVNATSSATSVPHATSLKEPKTIYIRTVQADATTINELFVPAISFKTASSTLKNVPFKLFAPLVKDLSQSSVIVGTSTSA